MPFEIVRDIAIAYGMFGVGYLACELFQVLYETRYHVCKPSQYMVKTGLGISDMIVSKHGIKLPLFQSVKLVDIHPRLYHFTYDCYSKAEIAFRLPIKLIVAPADPEKNLELFKTWARKMSGLPESEIAELIKSTLSREVQAICST
jgi:flotillin